MGESIGQFMDRQKRRVARFGREAEAAAHEAYGKAIRAGEDLKLPSPREVVEHGARLIQKYEERAANAVSQGTRKAKVQLADVVERVGQSPTARVVAVDAVRGAGNAIGVVRGGVHAVQGLVDGAAFASRLANPLDVLMSPPGESAVEQLHRASRNFSSATADYVQKATANPRSVVTDVTETAKQWRRDLDPTATPAAPTFAGELRRNFDIAQNQGELLFDVGSLFVGGPAAKAVKGLPRAANVGNTEKYLAQGFSPRAAAHLSDPYPSSNMGSHFIPRRTRLPDFLGGGPLPKDYMDGPFNRLVPPGISRGDFYELHYEVDPRFYGTGVRGERWSGRDLGLERRGPVGRFWYGSPAPLKARVGGLGAAVGGGLYDLNWGEQ